MEASAPDGGAPAPKTGLCSKDGWCWVNPLPQGHHLYGLWGSAKSKVWAVGEKGTILRFDGKAWSRVSSGTTLDLNAVAGDGAMYPGHTHVEVDDLEAKPARKRGRGRRRK